ncbi:serine/threonine-protein kinase prp4 [Plectosphaerella plurivora]|uniref:non-specific serine/threonine protein kinase n=1 Tax=Plectosphaerella plurivora TaxID=936078 RepID=A0A9P9A7K0_9PEZI|nr:serine/threonine-protein kinase prp4 [Plectosphaerella plurivora]
MVSSSDEGEIVENSDLDLKATSLPKKLDGNGVDRTDRQRTRYSASRSPEYGQAHHRTSRRSRSPPRSNKRPREEDDHRTRPDRRRFHVHYEDSDRERTQVQYDDPGRSSPRASTHNNSNRPRDRSRDRSRQRDNDRARYSDRGPRRRSRSPARDLPTNERVRERDDRRWRDGGRPDHHGGHSRPQRPGNLGRDDIVNSGSSRHSKVTQSSSASSQRAPNHRKEPAADKTPKDADVDVDFEEAPIVDEDAEIERRRKRRAELLAKSSSSTPLLINALHAAAEKSVRSSPAPTDQSTPVAAGAVSPQSDVASQGPGTPHNHGEHSPALEITSETDLINRHVADEAEDGPSAADYDPTVDMREDGIRDGLRNGHVGLHGEELHPDPAPDSTMLSPGAGEGNVQPQEADDDDDFDMFADDFDEQKYAPPQQSSAAVVVEDKAAPVLAPNAGGILEGDDKEGYYKIRIGELLNGRYQVQSMLGKGMFSGVARAVDIHTKNTVAIKIMRNNDALRKGGFIEINILQKLNAADPEGRKHIVRFEHHFDHKGHLCMAFENLSLNLREVLRKFGNNVGINLGATRAYAHQIFVGLAHMRKCSIIHADLKPDNILVNESRNMLKICDLGTGIDRSDAATAHNEVTPYLVSRFYRAPEVILGMPYDYAIDMWSIGCTLYEMYTGKILFAGDSNNQMLKAIMEIRGRFTPKLFKRGQLSSMHFDEQGNFISVERDKTLGKTAVRTLSIVKPTRDLRTRLLAVSVGMNEAEAKDLNHFIDLLEHCLALNPEKRIKPLDALKHPFFTSRSTQAK